MHWGAAVTATAPNLETTLTKPASQRPPPSPARGKRDLRSALVQATLELVEEVGPAAISVREVARRAGVSSGAPFRHFADKYALMAAVAEEGARRLNEVTESAVVELAQSDPLEAFRQAGIAYVLFAVAHPAHFRVMCVPEYQEHSAELRASLAHSREQLRALVLAAQAAGQIIDEDPELIMLAANAIIYGAARMFVDGQMQAEGIGRDLAAQTASQLTELLGRGIANKAAS